jgi:DNA (cytosine-5)-methyltransferase 1
MVTRIRSDRRQTIRAKIERIRAGSRPRSMDLFAGCGGISLGFSTAGFDLVASVEFDEWASASHATNFAPRSNWGAPRSHAKARDITKEDPEAVFADLGIDGAVEDQIDVLVGGPPCQAFARVGRAKLRSEARRLSLDEADTAFLVDGRVSLWERYLHYVRRTRPVALLMENVPDMLNHGGTNVAEIVAGHLRKEGYRVAYTLLNASWYGVPQTRERMFLIGIHEALGEDPRFPVPTHHSVLPVGYEGTRATARKCIADTEDHDHHLIDDPEAGSGLPDATTASEALVDLPSIFALRDLRSGRLRRGRKDPSEPCSYTTAEFGSAYSRLMRRWPGFDTDGTTTGHVIRYLPRDYKIFQAMKEGWQYPEVWDYVEKRRAILERDRVRKGRSVDKRTSDGQEFHREWTLPYDPQKFPNKWWKLCRDKPVRTLMAHLGKDSYSHIHFDGEQARTISIREAARLQSFPDGFVFEGSMNPAFKQIGNAVPPLLAYSLAMAMRGTIGCGDIPDIRVQLLGLPQRLIRTTTGRRG